MNSREIVRKTIEFNTPSRLAFDFYAYESRFTDMVTSYVDWEYEYEKECWFDGKREFYTDPYRNVWSRVLGDTSTKGEISKGVLQESWRNLDTFEMPALSRATRKDGVKKFFSEFSSFVFF